MPSLRQKVTTYFRQLSFIAEPRDSPRGARKVPDDDNFITKYLEGRMERQFLPGPEISNGQNPTDLPDLKIGVYPTGPTTITAACTGPDEGLTGIKRSKLHLSASYADDIDFIDTTQENDCFEIRKSINTNSRNQNKFNRFGGPPRKLSNSGITPNSDQNANKSSGMRSRKNSRTGIANLNKLQSNTNSGGACKDLNKLLVSETTGSPTIPTIETKKVPENANKSTTIVVSMVSTKFTTNDQNNKNILNFSINDGLTTTKSVVVSTNAIDSEKKESVHKTQEVDNSTKTLLDNTTERLLQEAVSNQTDIKSCKDISGLIGDVVAGVSDWHMETDYAYGISVSLYENNMLTKEPMGSPIADCYGIVVRGDAAAMALADGVNWGDGARLAARSAVHGCLDYLDRAIFGLARECMATSTTEVFVSLLRSLWEGHGCILEVGGSLSTLTIALVLPLSEEGSGESSGKYVVCACNVGDSLGYVYSKKYGVREFTLASHDITSMRDMRDALGALGPADGNKPELGNLTLSMTVIERGDIVFLTSDGISDNFDPVVGKFAEAWTPDVKIMPNSTSQGQHHLAPKRQNKSASSIYARLHHSHHNQQRNETESLPTSPANAPMRPPRSKKSSSPEAVSASTTTNAPSRPKYMRSHTVIEPRRLSAAGQSAARQAQLASTLLPKVPKSVYGLPLVTGPQRHALTLYRLEDLLSYGINGTFSPCTSARRLCHLLIDFARMITSARRKTLEQRELFYKLATGPDGIKREVELNRIQHRAARKRVVDSSAFAALPGKLDHATVVAYTVGIGRNRCANDDSGSNCEQLAASTSTAAALLQSKNFNETNF
ncbi:PP2C-like domain-containing protein CG9801 [Anastrepha ludens]|uniref:PP2C-like domain-containing protein CG9801 n=1 Tax=Anastrepha ludens TaxID=28586 RepID=UPI0023B03128|nr:PP2C-like domain-containing protein CG9801 [Anastrepha ludens]XP_053950730.1 PP2C-like domain-containing protein CG9801 [Anastrepha ludens]XP_053950731.1 PP2C-like domain-containing protein CG9801 [Anastrepha ludens]